MSNEIHTRGGTRIGRRAFLRLGLGAGAGAALWDLYHRAMSSPAERASTPLSTFEALGLDDRRLSRLLEIALESKGLYADIFLEQTVGNRMSFDGDRLQNVGLSVLSGAAIRVMTGEHAALRVTEDLTWEGLVRAAREAAAAARAGGRRATPAPLRPLDASNLYPVDAPATLRPFDEKREYVLRMVEAARAAEPSVINVQSNYSDSLRVIKVATSDGVIAHDTQPLLKVGLSLSAFDQKKGRSGLGSFTGGGHYGLEYFEARRPEEMGERAAAMARHQIDGVEPPAGELPVVLGPAYSGVLLHEAVGHLMEADFNVKGYSAYSGRLGQVVGSPLCTVVDDGRRPNLNGSINFDDEGVASSSTVLMEGGRLVNYMHSRQTAAQMGARPTGNGRRQDFSFPPQPRMTNTYLRAGDSDPEEIIRSVGYGIYAKTFDSGTANVTTGDFTFVPLEAYLIESGRVTAPLSNVTLLGNGPDILKRVSMVGNDMQISDYLWLCGKAGQMVPVTVGTPTVKVESVTVGGTRQS